MGLFRAESVTLSGHGSPSANWLVRENHDDSS